MQGNCLLAPVSSLISNIVQFTVLSGQENSQLCSTYTSLDGPTLTRAQILRKYSTCCLLYNSLSNKQEMGNWHYCFSVQVNSRFFT